jgi:hypothetical protein
MLSPEQVLYVGVIASILTQIVKVAVEKFGFSPSAEVKVAILFAISVALAAAFGLPSLPPISDPFAFAQALLAAAAGVLGTGALIYELLAKRVIFPIVRLG